MQIGWLCRWWRKFLPSSFALSYPMFQCTSLSPLHCHRSPAGIHPAFSESSTPRFLLSQWSCFGLRRTSQERKKKPKPGIQYSSTSIELRWCPGDWRPKGSCPQDGFRISSTPCSLLVCKKWSKRPLRLMRLWPFSNREHPSFLS